MTHIDYSDGIRVAYLNNSLNYSKEQLRKTVPEHYLLRKYANTDIQELIDRENRNWTKRKAREKK